MDFSERVKLSTGFNLENGCSIMKMKSSVALLIAGSILVNPVIASAQSAGQLLGGALGAAVGSNKGAGGAVVGAIIGVAMATILEQLNEQEKAKREASLQKAAQTGSSSWSSTGKDGKKATYKKVGEQTVDAGGQKCQKVKETITLADGKQGVSEENVCFS